MVLCSFSQLSVHYSLFQLLGKCGFNIISKQVFERRGFMRTFVMHSTKQTARTTTIYEGAESESELCTIYRRLMLHDTERFICGQRKIELSQAFILSLHVVIDGHVNCRAQKYILLTHFSVYC